MIWYAGSMDQLKQAGKYFAENPFVADVHTFDVLLKDGRKIELAPLTGKRARSKRSYALIYDEEREMKAQILMDSRGTINHNPDPHILHLTTPGIGTPAEDTHDRLQAKGTECCRPYTGGAEDHFMNPELIESDRAEMPKWWFDIEYGCVWTVPGGPAFPNLREVSPDEPVATIMDAWGVDLNGEAVGFVAVHVGLTPDRNLAVLEERVFPHSTDLAWVKELHYVNVEDGGYNTGYAELAAQHGAARAPSTLADQSKRVAKIQGVPLIAAPIGLRVTKEIREASLEELVTSGKIDLHTRHYLAAFTIGAGALLFSGQSVYGSRRKRLTPLLQAEHDREMMHK